MLSNPYRGNPVTGTLTVIVWEDVAWWWAADKEVRTYTFPVSLEPQQSLDCHDLFRTYKNQGTTIGFYLKAYWKGTLIGKTGEGYPPRLKVS